MAEKDEHGVERNPDGSLSFCIGTTHEKLFWFSDGRGGRVEFTPKDLDNVLFDILTMDYGVPDNVVRKLLDMEEDKPVTRRYTFAVTVTAPSASEAGDVAVDLASATSALGYYVGAYELTGVDGEAL